MSAALERAALERAARGFLWKAALVGAVAFGVFVWGGYGAGWSWSGLSAEVPLWDWP